MLWLRRTKSRVPNHNHNHNAASPKFACSSFKDIQSLLSEQDTAGAGQIAVDSPRKLSSICHRIRSANSIVRSLSLTPKSRPEPPKLPEDDEIRIPGAEKTIVVYFTSLHVVRRTFEDCKSVRSILRSFPVSIDERDLSMDPRFAAELQRIMGEKSQLTLPRVFIGGRHVGGAEEVRRLHESGELKAHFEGLNAAARDPCELCGGHRFVLCRDCSGSHKRFTEKGGFSSCTSCNENGLVRCPSCCYCSI